MTMQPLYIAIRFLPLATVLAAAAACGGSIDPTPSPSQESPAAPFIDAPAATIPPADAGAETAPDAANECPSFCSAGGVLRDCFGAPIPDAGPCS